MWAGAAPGEIGGLGFAFQAFQAQIFILLLELTASQTSDKETKFLKSPLSQQEMLLNLDSNVIQFRDYKLPKQLPWKCGVNKNKAGDEK